MKEKVEFRQVRDFGTIISDTFLFIRENFKPLMKTFFTICGIFMVAGIISMFLYKIKTTSFEAKVDNESAVYSVITRSLLSWEYFLLIIVSMVNYVSMYVAILSFITSYIKKGNMAPSLEEVWEEFKHFFLRVFGSTFLMSVFLILCFAACILPGIYVFPAVTLFYPIMIFEDAAFSHSFSRSFSLLKNEWWITAAVIFVIYIIFYMSTFVVQLPATILTFIGALSHSDGPISTTYLLIISVFTYLAQVFVIIPIVASAFIYFNLVETKENVGLINRINTLGQQQPLNDNQEEY